MIVAGNFAFGLVECISSFKSSLTIEPQHNERFISLLDQHLPHWRIHRQEKELSTFAHRAWSYRFENVACPTSPDLSLTNCFTRGVIPTPLMQCSA